MSGGPVLVLHTTESDSMEGAVQWMVQKNIRSHAIYDPARDRGMQLVAWHQPARSLRNESGGVQTNRRGKVYQLEIVGHAKLVPGYSDRWFENLAGEVQRICEELDVPVEFPVEFIAYAEHPPSSYGKNNGVRLSFEEWDEVTGIIGHMHVPENTHGDPGDMTRLVEIMAGGKIGGPTGDDPIKASQRTLQALGVYSGRIDGIWGPKSQAGVDMLAQTLSDADAHSAALQTRIDGLAAELDESRKTIADLKDAIAVPDDVQAAADRYEVIRRAIVDPL